MPDTDWDELEWLQRARRAPQEAEPEPKAWYKIDPIVAKGTGKAKKKTATVYIFDEIWAYGSSARQFAEQVAGLDVAQIDLHINSPGGEYPEGVAIMNMLREHKAHVTATVDGLAASAATIVAMGADEIVAAQGSQMMVHEASGLVYGPMTDMLKMAQVLEKTNAAMASVYAGRAGGTADQWREAMSLETWYNAQEAVDAGLADRLDPKAAEDEVVAARNKWDMKVYAHAGRENAPAPFTPDADTPDHEEDEEMPNKYLVAAAKRAGVKDPEKFADDEKLSQAMEAAEAEAKKAAEAKLKEGADGKDDKDGKPGEGETVVPGKIPAGFALVDQATLADLQASGHKADEALKRIEAKERDVALDAAVAKGKIPLARREFWSGYWDKDPKGAQEALAALPDNLVPVATIGTGEADENVDADYRALYPEEVS
jgi:ATP-dependent protease ClpP protease subunit